MLPSVEVYSFCSDVSTPKQSKGKTGTVRIGVVVIVRLKTIEDGAIRRTTDDCFKEFENRGVRRRILRIRCCGQCPFSLEVGHVPLRKVIVMNMSDMLCDFG